MPSSTCPPPPPTFPARHGATIRRRRNEPRSATARPRPKSRGECAFYGHAPRDAISKRGALYDQTAARREDPAKREPPLTTPTADEKFTLRNCCVTSNFRSSSMPRVHRRPDAPFAFPLTRPIPRLRVFISTGFPSLEATSVVTFRRGRRVEIAFDRLVALPVISARDSPNRERNHTHRARSIGDVSTIERAVVESRPMDRRCTAIDAPTLQRNIAPVCVCLSISCGENMSNAQRYRLRIDNARYELELGARLENKRASARRKRKRCLRILSFAIARIAFAITRISATTVRARSTSRDAPRDVPFGRFANGGATESSKSIKADLPSAPLERRASYYLSAAGIVTLFYTS